MPSYSKGNRNSKPKKPKNLRKRRSFGGNQFSLENCTEYTSTSAKKLHSYNYSKDKNNERLVRAKRASDAATKKARSASKNDKQIEEESYTQLGNLLYGPGIAD